MSTAQDTLQSVFLNDYNQKLAVQRLALAEAYGQPGIPPNSGISTTTNHFYDKSTSSTATPSPAAPALQANGLGSLIRSAGLAAALLGTGGAAGIAIPAISNLLNNIPATAQPTTQPGVPAAAPTSQYDITFQVDSTGKLVPVTVQPVK